MDEPRREEDKLETDPRKKARSVAEEYQEETFPRKRLALEKTKTKKKLLLGRYSA